MIEIREKNDTAIEPGEIAEITVTMTSPKKPISREAYAELEDRIGDLFGEYGLTEVYVSGLTHK